MQVFVNKCTEETNVKTETYRLVKNISVGVHVLVINVR